MKMRDFVKIFSAVGITGSGIDSFSVGNNTQVEGFDFHSFVKAQNGG